MKSLLPPELQSQWNIRDTVPRRDRLRELAFAGYRIPRCGMFADMARLGVPLVVYTDELAHCGEGKVLWKPGHAFEWPMSVFCSEYVPDIGSTDTVAVTYRELWVGNWRTTLRYASDSSWMSNVDGDFRVEDESVLLVRKQRQLMPYPMFSVDYTQVGEFGDTEFFHFDLNVCPFVPLEIINMVGRDVLQKSVADFCRSRRLIA